MRRITVTLALLLGGLAVAQAIGGIRLMQVGGSSYYLVAALVQLAAAVLLWRDDRRARLAMHVLLLGTVAWAVWETGGNSWGMLARLGWPVGLWFAVMLATRRHAAAKGRVAEFAVAAGLVAVAIGAIFVSGRVGGEHADDPQLQNASEAAQPDSEWLHYGRTLAATRFSPLTQITPQNVSELDVAWTYRTGDLPRASDVGMSFTFEATPLKVGDSLFLCTPHNIVIALNADTGEERWRFDPKVDDHASYVKACRGVSYFKASEPVTHCPERILSGTLDGRLIALDAQTGTPCGDFGENGQISVLRGLDSPPPGFAYLTSAPLIIEGRAVVGGYVLDGWSTGMPSGAIRAFDAITGAFAWAWDMGRPGDHSEPPPGESYTPGTPNAWAPMSADPELGLIYLPMGNATPDFWGGHRNEMLEEHASAIVALEARTGALKWSFQTVHHDIWDYDIPANPILFEMQHEGQQVPALAQVTKSGLIFVLDRRTGEPIHEVEEKPAPQGAAAGDWTSPTQPFPTTPSVAPPTLTEASMWGLTPFDQMACRRTFRTHRYEGMYTPPSEHGSILYPSMFGAVDWGAATVDEDRGLLIVNSNWLPFLIKLIPREEADAIAERALAQGHDVSSAGISPQKNTPFGLTGQPMLSPLGIPCPTPPWGHLTAIDLENKRIAWQRPFGTARDTGPLGSKVGLPIETGVYSMGGPTSTRSGLTFIAASLDRYIRAYDSRSGKELWRARLPAGGQSSPMTYWSGGRQFVVVAAGGHGALGTPHGDYVIAYALPPGTPP